MWFAAFLLVLCSVRAEVYFEEKFDDADSVDKWDYSTYQPDKQGKVEWSAGSNNLSEDKGLMTTEDNRFYWLTRNFDSFSNDKKTLVLQYSMRFDKRVTCGGSYLKLLGKKSGSTEAFNGDTPYHIMFGPDICGMQTKKVHVILNYKGNNELIKKEIVCKDDLLTHHYALILTPDNRYKVMIDCEETEEGALDDDFCFFATEIDQRPSVSKPSDWVEDPKMDDPNDKKPDDWDVPKQIPNPNVTKPDD